jgi:MraZ protein
VAQPGDDEHGTGRADGADRADGRTAPAPSTPPFLGTHHPRLDDKCRLFLPAKFRDRLAGGLVITPGQERCLYLFPDAEFARLFEGIRQAPVTSKRARDYQRMFLARASAETPDKQGRVTVPPDLRSYAALSKDCVVVGAGTRVEVWDADAWTSYAAEQEGAFADLSEEVLPGLI